MTAKSETKHSPGNLDPHSVAGPVVKFSPPFERHVVLPKALQTVTSDCVDDSGRSDAMHSACSAAARVKTEQEAFPHTCEAGALRLFIETSDASIIWSAWRQSTSPVFLINKHTVLLNLLIESWNETRERRLAWWDRGGLLASENFRTHSVEQDRIENRCPKEQQPTKPQEPRSAFESVEQARKGRNAPLRSPVELIGRESLGA